MHAHDRLVTLVLILMLIGQNVAEEERVRAEAAAAALAQAAVGSAIAGNSSAQVSGADSDRAPQTATSDNHSEVRMSLACSGFRIPCLPIYTATYVASPMICAKPRCCLRLWHGSQMLTSQVIPPLGLPDCLCVNVCVCRPLE